MKVKTAEEYILNELEKTKEELSLSRKKVYELENQLMNPSFENMNCIHLSEQPHYYYYTTVSSAWQWNKILKDNGKDPGYVKEALEDDKKILELAALREKSTYSATAIGIVDERIYNYLLKDRMSRDNVIILLQDYTYLYTIDDKSHFLNKEKAELRLIEEVKQTAEKYLRDYQEKFYEE